MTRALSVTSLLVCGVLVSITDSFRHTPEDAWNNPIAYLARNREAIKTATLLEGGGTLTFDSRSGRYAGPITERFNLTEGRQHRWFLFDGFGQDAVFESGDPEFRGEAQLLLPMLAPRPVRMTMTIEGPPGARVGVAVAGREIAAIDVGGTSSFLVPASVLIRGDNLLTLKTTPDQPLRLRRFEARLE